MLDTRDGKRYVVNLRSVTTVTLGRRLDPANLPPIAAQDVAMPITYGPAGWKAVIPPVCSTWGRFRACVISIYRAQPNGAKTRLLRQPSAKNGLPRRWTFLALSPDGSTLLLEQDRYSCGADA